MEQSPSNPKFPCSLLLYKSIAGGKAVFLSTFLYVLMETKGWLPGFISFVAYWFTTVVSGTIFHRVIGINTHEWILNSTLARTREWGTDESASPRSEVRSAPLKLRRTAGAAEIKASAKVRHNDVVSQIVEAVIEGRVPRRAEVREFIKILEGRSWSEIEEMMRSAAARLFDLSPSMAIALLQGNLLPGSQISPRGEIYGGRPGRRIRGLVPMDSSPVGKFTEDLVAAVQEPLSSA